MNRSRLLGVVRKVTMRERLIRVRSESSFEQWTREAYEEIGEGFVKIYFYLFVRQFCLMLILDAAVRPWAVRWSRSWFTSPPLLCAAHRQES